MEAAEGSLGSYHFGHPMNKSERTTVFMFKSKSTMGSWLESDKRKRLLEELEDIDGVDPIQNFSFYEGSQMIDIGDIFGASGENINEFEESVIIWLGVFTILIPG